MRKNFLILIAGTALISCGAPEGGGDPAPISDSPNHVVTKLLEFQPRKLTVPAGTEVTWDAGDNIAHTVTSGTFAVGADGLRSSEQPDGKLDQPLAKGRPVTFTFTDPGTYQYYCSIHKGMQAEIDVTR